MRVIKNDLLGGTNMYIYQITNLINDKIYIGQTNNITKRWSNHKCCNSPNMVIAKAIKKYGVENFKFEILYRNVPIEQIDELEQKLIVEKNCRVPNGYNVALGGSEHTDIHLYGSDNSNAHLTQEEAQYILDNRNQPIYLLYSEFSDKISYESFCKVYHNQTYQNLTTTVSEYPYNREFACQFTSGKLEYDDICNIRSRYAKGEYWRDVYKDYLWACDNEWSFWNIYYGNRYKLVMPEVFTEENRKKHSSFRNQGAANGRAKLTEEDVLTIRKLHKEGTSNSELYKAYPQVSKTTIRDIINGNTWKSLL